MPARGQLTKKLKSPLYCAVWIEQYCLVAGGGGRQSTGLPNRVWCVKYDSQGLGEVVAQYDIQGDAPMRMVVSQRQDFLLLAMGFGGLHQVDLDLKADPPVLVGHKDEQQAALQTLGDINCIALSSNMRLLALGIRDGPVRIHSWPDLAVKANLSRVAIKASAMAPREVAFSTAHGDQVAAVIYEDGSCVMWDIWNSQALTELSLPPDLKGCSFSRVRFPARAGVGPMFYTAVNGHRSGYLVQWAQDRLGDIVAQEHQKVYKTAITAFDLSKSGSYLGVGTSDGDVAIYSAQNLQPIARVKQGHMVFCTAVAFSSASAGLLSVSGDASMRVLPLRDQSRRPLLVLLTILVLLIAVLLGCLQAYSRDSTA